MGLDTHAYLSKARTWHTAALLIGSPRPLEDRPPVRQPYQGILADRQSTTTRGQAPGAATLSGDPCCLYLWSPVRDRVTDSGTGPRCSNLIRRSIFYGMRFMELVPSTDPHGQRRQPRGSDLRPAHASLDGTMAAAWVAHRHALSS